MGKKREETFRRAREEDPSPRWTEAIDGMCTEEGHNKSNIFSFLNERSWTGSHILPVDVLHMDLQKEETLTFQL